MATITGAKAIIKSLEKLKVDTVFGLPGGAVLNTFNEINDETKFRFILTRHEQGAGHAASGYALATGRPGVVLVTSGPGATNIVTPVADANADSVPMIVITGQVGIGQIGTDAFQESDIVGITRPIVKHSYMVSDANEIATTLKEAYHIAWSGRPGPVLVDITKNAQLQEIDLDQFEADFIGERAELLGYEPRPKIDQTKIDEAIELILGAKKPVIYAGGGCIRSYATDELQKFIELTNFPLVSTLQSRGVIPEDDPHNLSMAGMHGSIAATAALQSSDLILVLGARFSDRVTGKHSKFATGAKVIHIDIDPSEFNKNRHSELNITGNIKDVLNLFNTGLVATQDKGNNALENWWTYLNNLRSKYPFYHTPVTGNNLSPSYIIERIGKLSKEYDPNTVYAVGVGQHQMWASQFLGHKFPHNFLSSGGLGTMGFGVPAGMGAKAGLLADKKDSPVWVIDGDGCFQMTNQELVTCIIENIPIKVAVINNSTLGMPRQWQTLFFNKHYQSTDLYDGIDVETPIPDFVKLAEAYGCLGIRVKEFDEIDKAIKLANETNDKCVVIDFIVDKDAKVFPMVPAGASNNEVMYAPDLQPLLEDTDLPSLRDASVRERGTK
jgi:acetolactate synthase-1/2/3 large subunit